MKTTLKIFRYHPVFDGILPLMLGVFLSGCFGAYGNLRSSPSVTLQFKEMRVPTEYQYYFNGREFMPYAVIGIRKDLKFNARMWTPVDPKDEKFKKMLDFMYYPFNPEEPVGAEILDPEGRPAGIWYSTYHQTAVKMEKDGSISILSPYIPENEGRISF